MGLPGRDARGTRHPGLGASRGLPAWKGRQRILGLGPLPAPRPWAPAPPAPTASTALDSQEVEVRSSSDAQTRQTPCAAAGRARSPRTASATSVELTVCGAHLDTSPRATTRPASPGPTAPWWGSERCRRPATAQMPSVRTGAHQPHRPKRPRAPQPGPPLLGPPLPGQGPHRNPRRPTQSPPRALNWLPSWAWAWAWSCWRPWLLCWSCSCTTGPGDCCPTPPSPPGKTASGSPSKRSTRTPTPAWPRPERRPRGLGARGPSPTGACGGALWCAPTSRHPVTSGPRRLSSRPVPF